jgi:predicted molibdopterin-dependent oxidoreductase YjgC
MFRRLPDLAKRKKIPFTFDGQPLSGLEGDTVAAALLANGIVQFRTHPESSNPRSAYCLKGACFDCLVIIDGIGSRQACMTPLCEHMAVETQRGARALSREKTE